MADKGLGDTVKRFIVATRIDKVLGLEDCEPCKARQKSLNEAVSYKTKDK